MLIESEVNSKPIKTFSIKYVLAGKSLVKTQVNNLRIKLQNHLPKNKETLNIN